MKRILLLALLALFCGQSIATELSRPNLLFILADDLGYGDLACHGAPDIRTPRLDALAAQGLRFTDAYANGPTCSPTRYAFITGRYQQRGGLEYALYYQERSAGLPPDGETLPRLLNAAGWRTALIGKWHLGYDAERTPNAQGFRRFFGLLGGNHHYFQHRDRLGHHDLFLNGEAVKREGYSTDLFTDDAIRFLREPRDRSFFLFLSHPAPHFPYQGPGDAGRKVEPKKKSWQSGTRANYVSMVEHLDQSVGRVLDELDRLGLAASTLVVFTSDNGGDPMGRNLPLSGLKGTLSEGGIRVPCLARWPGVIPAGKTNATPIITMDWTATFLALAGVTRCESPDGVNLLPLLRGESDALPPRDLFWRRVPEPVRGKVVPQRAVRSGAWKYLEEQGRPPRLFDLAADLAENRDLSSEHREVCAQLRARLDAWEATLPASNPPFASFSSPADKAELTQTWQERAAAHARILSHVKWTPVADTLPNRKGGFFENGREYTGVPYSSVRSEGRTIGFDIGLRTFLAAVENPRSVLYTENLTGKVANAAAYYGSVCSAYTSYALGCGIPEVSRRYGPPVGRGIELVNPQSAQAAHVGDVIYTPHATETSGSHVEMVTAVTRDKQGRVTSVRVEESRPPTTQVTDRSAANFNAHLATRNKQLFRITDLEAWRGANRAEPLRFPNFKRDAATPTINRALLLDLGDWVPYQKRNPVKFNVMDRNQRGVKTLVIRCGGKLVEEIALEAPGVHERRFDTCGDYTAHVVHRDGTRSQACEFAVCDLDLRLPGDKVPLAGDWNVGFGAENMNVIAVYLWNSADSYGRHPVFLTPEQSKARTLTIPAGLLKKAGALQVWLIGEHKLGRLKLRKDISLVK